MATPTIKYVVADAQAGVPAYSQVDSTPKLPLGAVVEFQDLQTGSTNAGNAVAVYCQGSNVAGAGQFVHIVSNSAVLLDSGNSASFYPIGIAGGALSATNQYGFVGIQGLFDNGQFTNVVFAAGGRVAFASVAGQIGSVTALGSRIQGIVVPTSYTSADGSLAALSYRALTVQLDYPFAIGVTASN